MAPDVRATTDITSIVGNFYDRVMLERLVSRAVLYNLADKKPIPKGSGTTINFNRFTNFPAPTSKLTEGEVPTISYLSGTAVTATLFQLGAYTAVSDMLEMTSFSNVVKECVENFGDSAAISVDRWIFSNITSNHATDNYMSMLAGDDVRICTWFGGKQGGLSTVFISASGLFISGYAVLGNYLSVTANVDVYNGYGLSLDVVQRAASQLRQNNVRPFSDGYYKCVLHPVQSQQISRTAEWASWQVYTRPEVLDKGELGRAHGVRFYESTVISPLHTDQLSQYSNLCAYFAPIWGQGAFAVTELPGEKGPKITVKGPNKYDTGNPLDQWSTIGWKVTMAAKTLNASCGYVLFTVG